MADCKKALEETEGNIEEAMSVLKARGKVIARKKSSRTAGEGIIESYIHHNRKVGVLLDLRCETDFVARSEEFKKLAYELALQIAAMNPKHVKPEEISEEILEHEKKIFREEFAGMGKPDNIIDQMVEGKMNKHFSEVCLLNQTYVQNSDQTVKELIEGFVAKLGENIEVSRFVRYEI